MNIGSNKKIFLIVAMKMIEKEVGQLTTSLVKKIAVFRPLRPSVAPYKR
jgi:hypothetical protein